MQTDPLEQHITAEARVGDTADNKSPSESQSKVVVAKAKRVCSGNIDSGGRGGSTLAAATPRRRLYHALRWREGVCLLLLSVCVHVRVRVFGWLSVFLSVCLSFVPSVFGNLSFFSLLDFVFIS